MSWQATAWAKEVLVCPNGETITRSEKFVLLMLADDHRVHDGLIVISMSKLAENFLMSVRHARRAIRSMEAKGLIETILGDPRRLMSNCYRFPQLSTDRKAVKPTDTTSAPLRTPCPQPTDISIPPLRTLCPQPTDIAMSASSLKILRREELRAPAKNAGLVDKSENGERKIDLEPLVKSAAAMGRTDAEKKDLVQWVLSMATTLKSEPRERTMAVIKICLEKVKAKIAQDYDIRSVWGLLTPIFNAERTKYIQGPENEANKRLPIPQSMRDILAGIGKS